MERHTATPRKLALASRWLLPTLVMVWLGACGVARSNGDPTSVSYGDLPAHVLPAAAGAVFGLAWVKDGALVFVRDSNVVGSGTTTPFEAWQLDPSTGSLSKLDFVKSDSGCARAQYLTPAPLPDGRVGFSEDCERSATKAIPDVFRVVAVDPNSHQSEVLVNDLPFLPQETFWNTAITRAITSDLELSLCPALVWLGRDGVQQSAIEVSSSDGTWRLDEPRPGTRGNDCQGLARASLPRWSPNGGSLAVVASPRSEEGGMARINEPWDLYLVDIRSGLGTSRLTGLLHPQAMAWAPDSRTLAFSASYSGREGTWTYDVVSRKLRHISKMTLHWISWSADGLRIAGFVEKGISPGQPINYELEILDASALRSTG